jgi:galactose mutarotase-like enzyme
VVQLAYKTGEMKLMVSLKNNDITVDISPKGAELQSIRDASKTEYLWNGDKTYWAGRAPLLFPICGGLKDNTYRLSGQKYTLQKHGYARFSTFETERQTADTVTFLLRSDEESRITYPYDYELRVTYKLKGYSVEVGYTVTNLSCTDMYFSIGAHEGYACPEGIENYDILFPQNETLNSYMLDGNLLEHHSAPVLHESDMLKLKYDFFAVDALVFKELKSRSATLRNHLTGRGVRVDFDGFDYFLLWTKPGAPYICIEPWCGIQDSVDTDQEFVKKEGIQRIEREKSFRRTHTITILEG